jgi:hypothetical protein
VTIAVHQSQTRLEETVKATGTDLDVPSLAVSVVESEEGLATTSAGPTNFA